MHKPIVYVAAWLAAGAVSVAFATMGVSMVGSQVTGSRPAPLTGAEVRGELANGTTTTTVAGATTTLPPGDDAAATFAAGHPSSPPTTTSVLSHDGAGESGEGGERADSATAPAGPVSRTYVLTGGTVTLQFTSGGVTVQEATPNPGYSAAPPESTHDNGVRVEFDNGSHQSRVEGWWDDGPQDEVREES